MKLFFTIIISLLMFYSASAQFPTDIDFRTQAEIDNFQARYPNFSTIEGNVTISDGNTADIQALDGLNGITSIGGNLQIANNKVLLSLSGLNNLVTIGGSLIITGDDALTSLAGLNNLSSIGGDFSITNNYALGNLSGLDYLVSIAGSLISDNNRTISSLTGPDKLTSIGGGLLISYNKYLVDLSGLESVTFIGGALSIWHNLNLVSFSGLEHLTSIPGDISILYNQNLTSLSGLGGITSGTIKHINISNNYSLTDCSMQSICDYLALTEGNAEIYNNAQGCNIAEEILAGCSEGVVETSGAAGDFKLYPNPSSDITFIEVTNLSSKTSVLTIFDLDGRKILERYLTEWQTAVDVSGLPHGVYFVKVSDDSMAKMEKLLKQ